MHALQDKIDERRARKKLPISWVYDNPTHDYSFYLPLTIYSLLHLKGMGVERAVYIPISSKEKYCT